MTAQFQNKRRINGAAGAPAAAGAKEGEIALNFPGAAGTTTKPELWAFDGTGWRLVNPTAAVTTQSVTLGAGADIGAAYTAWAALPGNTLTGSVIIATYGTPAQAYVLTNTSAPGAPSSWTSLGGAVAFATSAEILTGTDTTKAINSDGLRGATTVASAGAADLNKIPRLDVTGKLDLSVLPASATKLAGTLDPTLPPPAGAAAGNMYFVSKAGTVNASFTGASGQAAAVGDTMIFDGTTWYLLADTVDLSAYVPLAGTNLMTGNIVWTGAANNRAGVTILDGKGGTIDNVLLDAGTY